MLIMGVEVLGNLGAGGGVWGKVNDDKRVLRDGMAPAEERVCL